MSWSECVMDFSAAYQRHMIVQYCSDSGSTNNMTTNVTISIVGEDNS